MRKQNIKSYNDYSILHSNSYFFAGRLPYVIEFSYRGENYTIINIHYKCCDGSEERRLNASIVLEEYINSYFSDEKVIVVGDFNDLLIDNPNVFEPFLSKPNHYTFLDYDIASGSSSNWSFPNWPSHIDHILVSNEILNNYLDIDVLNIDQLYFNNFSNYDTYISDHRPLLLILD